MDELYAFLFAGLGMMLMLFIFFGGIPLTEDESETGKDMKYRIIELGDISVEEEAKEVIQLLDDGFEIYNGVLFGSVGYNRKFDVSEKVLENLDKAVISFDIDKTNNYGELTVIVNNNTLYCNSSPLGNYDFDIIPVKENLINIKTHSSGWKVWAPSVYEISNLSLYLLYSVKESSGYEFDVPSFVYSKFHKGEIMFTPIKATEEIKILINGDEVYEAVPTNKEVITFSKEFAEPGENQIEFLSDGEYLLENVKIRMFYTE
ncbi:MAG: hypothetical protein KAU95_01995 [Candidatus Aenigmarchaeota archaeon]|nr:hypothetical protein [Candidatus Aenigmarchaeota archaeon]